MLLLYKYKYCITGDRILSDNPSIFGLQNNVVLLFFFLDTKAKVNFIIALK